MMRSYLTVLKVPGALAFCMAGLLARFGGSMVGIGTVVMASNLYGNYGIAGGLSAANSVAWAVGTAFLSNLVDRYGQRRIMLPAALISAASLAGLVTLALFQAPIVTLFISTIISGFTGGSPGAMVRARWNYVLRSSRDLHTAYSLESTLDEVCFVVGPVLAVLLATSIHPVAGLAAPVLFGVGGALIFYSLRATQPDIIPREPGSSDRGRFLLTYPGIISVLGVGFLMGNLFGCVDVTVVAATTTWNVQNLAGIVLGVMSLGSAVGGLLYGARGWATPLWKRFVIGVCVIGVAACTLLFSVNPLTLSCFGFATGFAVAPTFINANGLIGNLIPRSRLTEGLAWLGTAIGIGVSLGAAASGNLIDAYGYRAGFATAAGCGLMAATVGLISARKLKSLTTRPVGALDEDE